MAEQKDLITETAKESAIGAIRAVIVFLLFLFTCSFYWAIIKLLSIIGRYINNLWV